jgi:hypothetical protein
MDRTQRIGGSMDEEAIAARFLEERAIDFEAIGRLVANLGPELAVSKLGPKLVLSGGHFILACMMPAGEAVGLITRFQRAELGREVLGEQGSSG